MARKLRNERRGVIYHVMNRGVARRTIFDTTGDFRFFLAGLACAVRRKEIVVLAFALMRTHFHILLRSLGGLSLAMHRSQLGHVRRFNRMHERDGPLLRGPFLSKPVTTSSYRNHAVRYIHENPVLARLADRPEDYPWCSAWHAARPRPPDWLCLDAINRAGPSRPSPRATMTARAELVEGRLHARTSISDDLLDLTTPEAVLSWMRRKAMLADGAPHPPPMAAATCLLECLAEVVAAGAEATTTVPGGGSYLTWHLLACGLLRQVAGRTVNDIANRLEISESRVKRLCRRHTRCMVELESYALLASMTVYRATTMLDP